MATIAAVEAQVKDTVGLESRSPGLECRQGVRNPGEGIPHINKIEMSRYGVEVRRELISALPKAVVTQAPLAVLDPQRIWVNHRYLGTRIGGGQQKYLPGLGQAQ